MMDSSPPPAAAAASRKRSIALITTTAHRSLAHAAGRGRPLIRPAAMRHGHGTANRTRTMSRSSDGLGSGSGDRTNRSGAHVQHLIAAAADRRSHGMVFYVLMMTHTDPTTQTAADTHHYIDNTRSRAGSSTVLPTHGTPLNTTPWDDRQRATRGATPPSMTCSAAAGVKKAKREQQQQRSMDTFTMI